MASLSVAIDFVLKQEDALMSGDVTTLRGDSGGATRFGIASAYHPELMASGYFDSDRVSRESALAIAVQLYNTAYAEPLRITSIQDQAVATAVLSFGVNAGVPEAGKQLQEACVASGKPVTVDHIVGYGTLAAVNALDPNYLLAQFCDKVRTFYTDLATSNPNDAGDLDGWLNRVSAWQANAALLRSLAA